MMAEKTEQTEQSEPTAEEHQQAQQVAAAGATAAAEGRDAGAAMKAERDRVGLKMSDEDIERVAQKLNELNIKAFEDRGAFEAPPEPVHAPPETAPPPPGDQAAAPAGEAPPQPPQKRTAAHRFFGLS